MQVTINSNEVLDKISDDEISRRDIEEETVECHKSLTGILNQTIHEIPIEEVSKLYDIIKFNKVI